MNPLIPLPYKGALSVIRTAMEKAWGGAMHLVLPSQERENSDLLMKYSMEKKLL